MKLHMLIACIFRDRIKVDAYGRVGGGFAAANSSVCMVSDAISKKYMLLACMILFVALRRLWCRG